MQDLRAEVIAIGDEMTSGVRLDTNTQWISQRLGALGVQVAFHSTVGDDLDDNINVFKIASQRADVIVCTGGLGPTADDLTRQAIADMAGVNLRMEPAVLEHIKSMFEIRGRTMPENNQNQAWFPQGSNIINNPEGSAPGIDFGATADNGTQYRIFALPGVPVEMKQMWNETVENQIRMQVGGDIVIHHHTIHCFGAGESLIESMLPDLVARGRDPQVGITASAATISLRVTTRGPTRAMCLKKMQPTIETIRNNLGDLVFGENGIELHQVVVELLQSQQKTVSILDMGLNGEPARRLTENSGGQEVVTGSRIVTPDSQCLSTIASELKSSQGTDFGLTIGPVNRETTQVESGESFFKIVIADSDQTIEKELVYRGHSGWREDRAVKDVLNTFRVHLQNR